MPLAPFSTFLTTRPDDLLSALAEFNASIDTRVETEPSKFWVDLQDSYRVSQTALKNEYNCFEEPCPTGGARTDLALQQKHVATSVTASLVPTSAWSLAVGKPTDGSVNMSEALCNDSQEKHEPGPFSFLAKAGTEEFPCSQLPKKLYQAL